MERRKRTSVSRSKNGSAKRKVSGKRKVQRRRTSKNSFFGRENTVLFFGCVALVCAIFFVLFTGLDFKKGKNGNGDFDESRIQLSEKLNEKSSLEKREKSSSASERKKDEEKPNRPSISSEKSKEKPASAEEQNSKRKNASAENVSARPSVPAAKKNIPAPSESKNTENKNRSSKETSRLPSENKNAGAKNPSSAAMSRPSAENPPSKNEISSKKKNVREKNEFSALPHAKGNAVLVFLFDDAGQNLNQLEKFLRLPFAFTVAVLPGLAHSKAAADLIRQSGNEVMLHQPMQAMNLRVNPGPGAITPNMGESEIRSVLFSNIFEIGPVAGVNNHEGSLITADAQKMSYVMKFLSEEGLYFLDSRTSVETKVPYVAKEMGYSYYQRNVFLDNSGKRDDMIAEIKKGLEYANRTGCAIMIGHIWSSEVLPGLLSELYPLLLEKGYSFSKVSECPAKIGI